MAVQPMSDPSQLTPALGSTAGGAAPANATALLPQDLDYFGTRFVSGGKSAKITLKIQPTAATKKHFTFVLDASNSL